ncbi:hypothetical protein BC833DRAFT_607533 [Globomyces pollinis-pini]|nr:hypothetical protein BC833DRAFT_607533 [Globomyces pollinis-pini]KAJ2999102.1 hypothetical protein HDV02_003632 [Globomyces sp. JEL0801]
MNLQTIMTLLFVQSTMACSQAPVTCFRKDGAGSLPLGKVFVKQCFSLFHGFCGLTQCNFDNPKEHVLRLCNQYLDACNGKECNAVSTLDIPFNDLINGKS